uniref:Abhydrolase domain containing 13 n=1 Tax=Eptatretus burgeri TaxID=7764 RepID=A0A8C4R269_EPTBU
MALSYRVVSLLKLLTSRALCACRLLLLPLLLVACAHGGAAALVLSLVSLAAVLHKAQDLLLYFPEQPASSRLYVALPTGVPFESVSIRTRDGVRLSALFLPGPGPGPPSATLLYFHGNAGNLGHRLPNALLMALNLKVSVLLLDYRGYGRSEGTPGEAGLYADAAAALAYARGRPDVDSSRIIAFGRSLGGAVAVHLASQHPGCLAALLLENTFTSIPNMASALCPGLPLGRLPRFCFRNIFSSADTIGRCSEPTLFVSGEADTLVPPAMMRRLWELSPARLKRLATFTDGTHNGTWQCRGYFMALRTFLDEAVGPGTTASPEATGISNSGHTVV